MCKPEIGGELACNPHHKVMFGFFDHTRAIELTMPPDSMAHDFARKAVVLVTCGVDRRRHASLPMRGLVGSLRG
jgi:hypothetical protein